MKRYFYILIIIVNFNLLFGQVEVKIIDHTGKEFKSAKFLSIDQDSTIIKDKLYNYKLQDQTDSLMTKYVLYKLHINDISSIYVPKPNRTFLAAAIGGLFGYGVGTVDMEATKGMGREILTLVGSGIGLIYGMISSFDTYYDLNKMTKIEKVKLIESLLVNENIDNKQVISIH